MSFLLLAEFVYYVLPVFVLLCFIIVDYLLIS